MSDICSHLNQVAQKLGIGAYRRHVLLCVGPNCCSPEQGQQAWNVLKEQIKSTGLDRGEASCYRTKVGCLRVCCQGPILVVYPEGTWYHGMTADQIPGFVQEHLIGNRPVESLVFAQNPLPTSE